MNIIMSTKPVYVNLIEAGTKSFEYRKHGFTQRINRVYLYESKPVGKVTSFFTIKRIITAQPVDLWIATKDNAGMSKSNFFSYYKDNQKMAYAIQIGSFNRLSKPVSIHYFGLKHAPESFQYIRPVKPKKNHEHINKPFTRMKKPNTSKISKRPEQLSLNI